MDAWQAPAQDLYKVRYLSSADLQFACGGDGSLLWGCAKKFDEPMLIFSAQLNAYVESTDPYWEVYVDQDLVPAMRHCVLFHEYAHLPPNNWPADHPAGWKIR